MIAAALASGMICSTVRRKLAAARMLDRPNERSLHNDPVPRGGGIGLWAAALALWIYALHRAGHIDPNLPFLIGMAALLFISWGDDRKPQPAVVRLSVHLGAVILALMGMGDAPVFQGALPFWLDRAVAGLCWLWFINLFNFMDGIDGISGAESMHLSGGFLLIAALAGLHLGDEMALAAVIFGASFGFLLWNWHPARLFLGDVGSIPLGYALGYLMLKLALAGYLGIAFALPLYYLVDATFTLFKRMLGRKKFWQAHREHFYQQAALGGASHAKTVILMIITNMVLLGICLFSLKSGALVLAASPLPVIGLLWYLKRLAKR